MDILKVNWSPCNDLCIVLMQVQNLLASPNYKNGYVGEATNLLKENEEKFKEKAREMTKEFATGS